MGKGDGEVDSLRNCEESEDDEGNNGGDLR